MGMTHTAHLDQFDYDIAQLGPTLDGAQLDVLDAVLDARDASRDFIALLAHAQDRIEHGAPADQVRAQVASDLIDIAATLVHAAHQLGGATYFGVEDDL